MPLSREKQKQIIEAARKAHAEGRPLFKPKADPKKTKPEFTEAEIFAQMKKLGGTIR